MAGSSEMPRYEFGSAAEDHTLVLGLRAGQVALIVCGLVSAVLAVRTWQHAAGLAAAAAVVTATAGTALVPVRDRTVEQWLPTAVVWVTSGLAGGRRRLSDVALVGHDVSGRAVQQPVEPLADLRLLAAPLDGADGRPVGVAHDRRRGTYTVVLAVRGRSFQLADATTKRRRLAAWGSVLSGLARGSCPVYRLQWVERTFPGSAEAMAAWLDEAGVDEGEAGASYRQLVARAGPSSPRHETLLALSVSARHARAEVRKAGGGDRGAARVLMREVTSLHRQLVSADIVVDGVLEPRSLAGALRAAFDPVRGGTSGGAAGDGCGAAAAWPAATDVTWAAYRTDGAWHATYWIAQWPRTPVGPDFLTPLLLGSTGTRTVAVTMQPVDPHRAHRDAEQALLKQAADEELRSRAGFVSNARRRKARQTVARRQEELADGHADYRMSGYVTVSAGDLDELEVACGEIEQTARQAALDLQRLYGQQDVAFTFCLPLARGLGGRP